jgi:hypothetical protein
MRTFASLSLVGLFALAACDDAREVTGPSPAPEALRPQFHEIIEGTPDGDYSQYFVDAELTRDLVVKVAQEWDPATESTECPTNNGSHLELGDEPPFPGIENMSRAKGSGYFAVRTPAGRRSGILFVRGACWFDEWNPAGFPESLWGHGIALIGWHAVEFAVRLISNGFPAEGHFFELDAADLYLGDFSVPVARFDGEIHHEDGISLAF